MSNVNTETLVGVTGAHSTDVLGNVVWFSVAKGLVTPADLEKKLVDSGVGKHWMPNPIRVVDAFRRATKFKKKVLSDTANQYINYMVREVYADKEVAIRHLVAETVDQTGKRLNYNSEAGRIVLNKKEGILTVEHEDGNKDAQFYVESMAKDFEIFKLHYDAQSVRVMVSDILKSMAPVALRSYGGIYFIPRNFEDDVRNFVKLCDSLSEGSNAWKLPVVDTFEQRQMVTYTLLSHIKEIHTNCQSSLGKGLRKSLIREMITTIEEVTNNFKSYRNLIVAEDVAKMEKELNAIYQLIPQLMMEIVD
ncbi:hypothetical protein ABD87_00105 [Lysinibacillus sphaericus]|uniref:DUF6744 family protein n=1 Tax=Lysinibacillus sphaericus TaxID=1421 RepID=UPI0018CD5BA1|nr:DUF6744 family protein [Lysinibacillus sphaericus]MBG9727994.1 hypothetical protein [Lysinibacillus sphaericus]